MLRLLCLHLILHVQYSFLEASPLVGEDVRMAYLEEFPFIVSIGNRICGDVEDEYIIQSQFCGGTLITTTHVLTAAHCVSDKQLRNVVVKVGSVDVLNGYVYEIKWWITYSQWTGKHLPKEYNEDLVHDIAMIKLRETVSNIELPTIPYIPDADLYDKSVITAGWGVIEENKKPRYMRVAYFIVKSPDKCEPFIAERDPFLKYLFPKIHLCTSSARGTTATCGDSGSPLLRGENNIVGVNIASCRQGPDSPLYMYRYKHSSVYAYREFIEALKRV